MRPSASNSEHLPWAEKSLAGWPGAQCYRYGVRVAHRPSRHCRWYTLLGPCTARYLHAAPLAPCYTPSLSPSLPPAARSCPFAPAGAPTERKQGLGLECWGRRYNHLRAAKYPVPLSSPGYVSPSSSFQHPIAPSSPLDAAMQHCCPPPTPPPKPCVTPLIYRPV